MFEGMFTEENRKKIIIATVILLIVVIGVFYILPLFFSGDSSKILPSEIVLNEEELKLKTGESYFFIPDLYPSDATEKEIKWTSSNPMIVSVDKSGMIEAIRPGTAIITATTENKLTDFTIVEVVVGNENISNLSLNMEDISLKVGTKKKFEVILDPEDTKYESIEWETDNNKVVTIDQNGEVYGLVPGTAVITAKVKIDSLTVLSVSSNVHVIKETTLFANKSSSLKQLYPYKEIELSVSISDNTVQISNLEVYSTNNNIAKLVEGPRLENNEMIVFKIRAIETGSTDIVAKVSTKDGENLQLRLPVEVKPFTSVNLDKSSVSLYEGEQTIVNAKVSPEVGVAMAPICSTSDSSIATVLNTYANNDSYNGACLIKGIKKGKTTISVTLSGKQKSITVYVNSNTIETTQITLNHTNETIPVGQTLTIQATVSPNNATDKTVTWTSSDTDIVTVTNGIVTAHKPGKVTITAQSSGGQTAKATITVTETNASIPGTIPVESLSIDPNSALLNQGESITLRTTFYPADATDKTVTWTSSNPNVATVNNGVVTAKTISSKQETVTITATSGNGKIATATIYVVDGKGQIAATGITIDKTEITLEKDETFTLTATVTPSNATNKTVTWSSENKDVATVSNGVVTAVNIGETTITAKNSSGKTAKVTVKVIKKQSSSSGGGSGGSSGGGSGGGSGDEPSVPPEITIKKTSGTSGENGWYTSNVVLKVSVEAEAGLKSLKYCVSANGASCNPVAEISNGESLTLSNQGKSLQVKVTATDKDGNSTSKTSSTYKIDKTKPTCKITTSAVSTGFILHGIGSDSHSGLYGIRDWSSDSYITFTNTKSKNVKTAGTYKFYVKDKAGNTNSCSETLYKCGRVRNCKTCTNGDCTKGCDSWNSWTSWVPWNDNMYSVQTKTAYNQVESSVFLNSDCSNG